MKIAILGFGNVGQKLAELFEKAGSEVFIGLREQTSSGVKYPTSDFATAAKQADAIVLAIPYQVCAEVLAQLTEETSGKIIIDNTNPLNEDWSPKLLGQENSAAEEIARMLPEAKVIKAFNTIFADVMDKPTREGKAITAFIAGDDQSAKSQIMALADAIGYAPVDVGSLTSARYLESMAHLNIQIAVGQGGGTDAAFIYSH